MVNGNINGASFTGQIYDIRTKKDGGGRIQIDFGGDALEAIQFIQMMSVKKNASFEVAIVLLPDNDFSLNNNLEK